MDIKQATERVDELRRRIDEMTNILTMLQRRKEGDEDVHIDVWNPSGNRVEYQSKSRAVLTLGTATASLSSSIQSHKAEIAKLQPVIDMANAALKGVLS